MGMSGAPSGRWRLTPLDLVDVLVYVVVLNLAIQFVPSVISESFLLSLLTAVLLKIVLELVLLVKTAVVGRIRSASTVPTRVLAIATLVLVLPASKLLVLELVALVFGDAVQLGGFFPVTGLIIVLMLSRAGVRRLFRRDEPGGAPAPAPSTNHSPTPSTTEEPRPMRIVITGGAGFLGAALARRILTAGALAVDGALPAPVDEVILLDIAPPPADLAADERVTALTGDLPDLLPAVGGADVVFHLAGVVSGAAEADFDLGMRVNLDALRAVLDWARAMTAPPVLVFTSSLAVYGADPAIGPVGVVDDATLPRPQSSYGIQKFIGEQLVADAARRGFVRGRSVRLMTVSVRPGAPNAAASSFLSGMIREPIAGQRAVCPVDPDTPVALSSPSRTLDGILRAAEVDAVTWGSTTAMNLPALSTTPREMAAALDRVVGAGTSALIDWAPDARIESIVGSWPSEFVTDRAARLGLAPESSFDAIVADHLGAHGPHRAETAEAR